MVVDIHEQLAVLRADLEAGRIKLPSGSAIIDSLARIRFGSNGRIDLSTVDAHVRALLLAMHAARGATPEPPMDLRQIQEIYFDSIGRLLGEPYDAMKKHGLTPQQMAVALSRDPDQIKHWKDSREDVGAGIRGFWETTADDLYSALSSLSALKAVFGGDIFPSFGTNVACSTGMYIDTVVLPDPLLRVTEFIATASDEQQFFFLVKHGLNVLQYRDLALADVSPPIVVVAPDPMVLNREFKRALDSSVESDILAHGSALFGRDFPTVTDFGQFLSGLENYQALARELRSPDRLLFDVEWTETPEQQVARYRRESIERFGRDPAFDGFGSLVLFLTMGRMISVDEVVSKSLRFGGCPLIDAPTSWKYLQWKYEYDLQRGTSQPSKIATAAISHALAVAGDERFPLLRNVPPTALVELRRRGAMAEMRELISRGIGEIDGASDEGLDDVVDQVVGNLSAALAEHRREVMQYKGDRNKFCGFDVAPWLVVGGVSIAAAATGSVPLGVASALLGSVGAPSGRDLWSRGKAVLDQRRRLRSSPVAICFGDSPETGDQTPV